MTEITMPQLSDSMEQGTVLSWLKRNGDHVQQGDELVEIETDKATMTYESPAAGIIELLCPEGMTVAVGEPIARVGATTAVAASESPPPAPADPPLNSHTKPTEVRAARSRSAEGGSAANSDRRPAVIRSAAEDDTEATTGAVRATPLARRLASTHEVDLSGVTGSGPRGRVTRADVVAAAGLSSDSPAPAPSRLERQAPDVLSPRETALVPHHDAATVSGSSKRVQELTRVQQVIARRMSESKANVPHFQVQTEAELDALLALRAKLKAASDRPPSVNDFVVKAAALALREFPLANGSYRDGAFELYARVNVGVAVAADGALIVPTVTDADTRSLGAIAQETRRLATAVREGSVLPSELSGATFTVSNLGMFGMTAITPVINLPQAAILGVGAARPVLRRINSEIVDRQLMTLTLSCDHRILYGAEAARFLSRIRALLEEPLLLAF